MFLLYSLSHRNIHFIGSEAPFTCSLWIFQCLEESDISIVIYLFIFLRNESCLWWVITCEELKVILGWWMVWFCFCLSSFFSYYLRCKALTLQKWKLTHAMLMMKRNELCKSSLTSLVQLLSSLNYFSTTILNKAWPSEGKTRN